MGNSAGKKKKAIPASAYVKSTAVATSNASYTTPKEDSLSLSYLSSKVPPGVDSDAYKQMLAFYRSSSRSGKMNRQELKSWFVGILPGISVDILDLLFDAFDRDKSGEIDMQEFSFFLATILKGDKKETDGAIFDALDTNGDGTLSKEEIRRHLRVNLAAIYLGSVRVPTEEQQAQIDKGVDEMLDDVFNLIDTDKSGSIDRQEFIAGMGSSKVIDRFIEQHAHHLATDA